MRWAGHVAYMGEKRDIYTVFWYRALMERDHLGDPCVDVKIVLRWIFKKLDVGVWTVSSWLGIGARGGHL